MRKQAVDELPDVERWVKLPGKPGERPVLIRLVREDGRLRPVGTPEEILSLKDIESLLFPPRS